MEFKHVWKVIQWGYGEGADRTALYLLSVPARTLIGKADVYRRTPKRRNGYQREISDVRLGKGKYGVAGYLLNQMGLFPTSILVNVRKEEAKLEFEEEEKITDNISVGKLVIPDDVMWYVIDGQHRVLGLNAALSEVDEIGEYPLLVTMTNEKIFYEMLIFYMVNSRAKSVPTDLAYKILQRMLYDEEASKWIENEIMRGADRRKAVAATIVDYLNIKEESPFNGRIQETGEARKHEHVTTDGTLTRYVIFILKEKIFENMLDEAVADLLADYWGAIKEIYPKCFDAKEHEDYALLSTLGLSSMSRLFPVIYGYCSKDGDVSRGNMEKYLRYLLEETPKLKEPDFQRPITDKWWNKADGPGTIHGSGEGHYTRIANNFAQKIATVISKKKGGDT
ncbi:MAG: DGQHR domain-containing protein [Candidatus Freyarchaeum deiterrae]